MEPQIHFGYTEHQKWIGKTTQQLHEEMEKIRIAIKKSIDYYWDNSHFFVDSIYGKPALQVLFSENSISFWNAETGSSMGSFEGVFSKEDSQMVTDWIRKIEDHLVKCNDCDAWVKEEDGCHYSFAGFVCKKCYNPKVHLPPDTRGD